MSDKQHRATSRLCVCQGCRWKLVSRGCDQSDLEINTSFFSFTFSLAIGLDSQAHKSISAVFVMSGKSVLLPDLEKEQQKNSPTFILMHRFLVITFSAFEFFYFCWENGATKCRLFARPDDVKNWTECSNKLSRSNSWRNGDKNLRTKAAGCWI